MTSLQQENMAHMLASMHQVVRQADGKEETSGTYDNLSNTTYQQFIERYLLFIIPHCLYGIGRAT